MVTVTGFKVVVTEDGDSYVRLVLSGGLEMVQSKKTDNFYATTRRCTISSTFDDAQAKSMIGHTMPGSIVKVETEPYEFTLDNGEVLELSHKWVYSDETPEDLAVKELIASANGINKNQVELTGA